MVTYESAAISVILITPDRYERIRKTIGYLQAQTVKDRMELIIVAPSADAVIEETKKLTQFFHVQVVEIGNVTSLPHAMAKGVKAASAPIVAFAEDHAYPDYDWAEALIDAHRGPWAAVGPVVRNANPVNRVSWADFLVSYGPWIEHSVSTQEADYLPSHNCSYKRLILMNSGCQLDTALAVETVLHWNLRNKGHHLFVESRAKLSHTNFERFYPWIIAQFLNGRLFAASRRQHWSLFHRILYILGSPLIPAVRLWRTLRHVHRAGRERELLPGILPLLIAGLTVSGIGELFGYLCDCTGHTMSQLYHLEFKRRRDI